MTEIAVRGMHFHDFKSGGKRAQRRFAPAPLHCTDVVHAELVRHEPAGIHRDRARRYHFPRDFSACAITVVDRTVAVPRPLHRGLAAGMRELNRRYRAVGFDEIGNALQWRDVCIRPDAQVTVSDAAFGFDRGGFGENQSGAASGHFAEVDEMPVVGHPLMRRVLAHRGNDDAVLERDAAQGDRRKQNRLRCHRNPFDRPIANQVRGRVCT